MGLQSGTRLGPYEVQSALGAGGMGEVYRARDTRLDRTVAIKVLPAHLSSNPDLKQRFEREARAISSLNHPHICHLYDVGSQNGTDFLVMEYLEGETLAARLQKGKLPLAQVLQVGSEVAGALDKAHRQGIIHRDLKPGNIMLTKSGAKLLDFGLAKPAGILAPAAAGAAATASMPTLNAAAAEAEPLTEEGTLVGTFHYMAPEVLQGGKADARSDIFSLGCVLYEMITGKQAFAGKSQITVLAAILEKEPEPIAAHQPLTPPALDRVVKTCLEKDPEERWQSARELARELKWIAEDAGKASVSTRPVQGKRARVVWAVGISALVLLGATRSAWILRGRQSNGIQQTIELSLALPPKTVLSGSLGVLSAQVAVSPNGRLLALVVSVSGGPPVIWFRPLDSNAGQVLSGTEGATEPFWSPDGRSLGFFAEGKLKRIEVAGGPPQTICEVGSPRGGTWNSQGVILFTDRHGGLSRVSASGGSATPVTRPDTSREETGHYWPQFLPDGRHFIFLIYGPVERRGVAVGSLDSPILTRLMNSNSMALYASSYLLTVMEGNLLARRFDVKRLHANGEAMPLAQGIGVGSATRYASFSTAESGVMAYANINLLESRLEWFSRSGQVLGSVGQPANFYNHQLSPDGRRVGVTMLDPQNGRFGTWSVDLERGASSRLTFDASSNGRTIWSPDGKEVAFDSDRLGGYDIYEKLSSGAGPDQQLLKDDANKYVTQWSRDGRFILYHRNGEKTGFDLWVLPMTGDRKPFPYLQTPFNEMQGQLSPDSRWMAYTSDESGRLEVYVQSFPVGAGKWQISTEGGSDPHWRADGRELFYVGADNRLMAVSIQPSSSFQAGVPRGLFASHMVVSSAAYPSQYDVSADGQKFLINTPVREANSAPVTVLLNWTARLKK